MKINSFNYNCTTFSSDPIHISGLVAYYSEGIFNAETKLTITDFYYNNTVCENHLNYIVVLLFLYNTCYRHKDCILLNLDDQIHIQNSMFSNLKNSSVLCYYGQDIHDYVHSFRRKVMITNCTFSNNIGHPQLNMFYIVLNSITSFSRITMSAYKQMGLRNVIKFSNCIFTSNINMEALIYIRPPITNAIIGYIAISRSRFHKNINISFIKVRKESWNIFYVTTLVKMHVTPPLHAYMTVTLMLHACNISVYMTCMLH